MGIIARVYRMKFSPDVLEPGFTDKKSDAYEICRGEIFQKFRQYGIIGTGWGDKGLKFGLSDVEIRQITNAKGSEVNTFRILCNINTNDLIWMIYKSKYYLFKVSENCLGSQWTDQNLTKEKEWFLKRDISVYFKGEWLEVGNELSVPGVIINSMGIGATWMENKKAPSLSMKIWNQKKQPDFYEIDKIDEKMFWDLLTDRQEEGLVLSYLQKKYGCIVDTESLKHSTPLYECQLISNDGTRYLPQVKSGNTGDKEFPVREYYEKIKQVGKEINKPVIAVVFYENQEYGDFEADNLIKVTKIELMNFIKNNSDFVSGSILEAYSLLT